MSLQETLTVLKVLPLPIYWEMMPVICNDRMSYEKLDELELVKKEYKDAGISDGDIAFIKTCLELLGTEDIYGAARRYKNYLDTVNATGRPEFVFLRLHNSYGGIWETIHKARNDFKLYSYLNYHDSLDELVKDLRETKFFKIFQLLQHARMIFPAYVVDFLSDGTRVPMCSSGLCTGDYYITDVIYGASKQAFFVLPGGYAVDADNVPHPYQMV